MNQTETAFHPFDDDAWISEMVGALPIDQSKVRTWTYAAGEHGEWEAILVWGFQGNVIAQVQVEQ